MAISSLGVGSGLDLNSLVDNLLNAERVPVESRLDKKEIKLQAELSAFGALSSSLAALQTSLDPLKDLTEGRTARSSDGSVLGVSVDETANVAAYSIAVNQLATNDALAATGLADQTAFIGEGTLTFTFGTKEYTTTTTGGGPGGGGGTTTETTEYTGFTANPDKTSTTITIDSSNNTLEGIRDAINDADFGVTAVIVNDGGTDPYRLLLTSDDSGVENGINIAVNTTSGDLSGFAYDYNGGTPITNMAQTVMAQDAEITLNGLDISSSTNTFSEALPGVTLEVKKISDSPVSVGVNLDEGSAKEALSGFVETFNSLIENLDALSKYNPDTQEASILTGDSLVRSLKSTMRNQIITQFGDDAAAIKTFVDLGIKTGADGKLSIDNEILDEALDNNFDGVIAFANAAGEAVDTIADSYLGPGGTINSRQDSLRSGIDQIFDDRAALNTRLTLLEASLVKKYSALDTLLSGLQSTSNFITSQLATLDFSNNSNK
jgi:flagellar hook-associated protein 2